MDITVGTVIHFLYQRIAGLYKLEISCSIRFLSIPIPCAPKRQVPIPLIQNLPKRIDPIPGVITTSISRLKVLVYTTVLIQSFITVNINHALIPIRAV